MQGQGELVSRLLKQSIITLCRETVTYRNKLEIDGLICLAIDGVEQHVVKIHELFNSSINNIQVVKEEPRVPTPILTRSPTPMTSRTSGQTSGKQTTNENISIGREDDTVSKTRKLTSKLFETATNQHIPEQTKIKQEPLDEASVDSLATSCSKTTHQTLTAEYAGAVDLDKLAISNAKNILCKKCGQTIETVGTFENHNMVAHGHFTCLICLSTFTSRNNMKRHIRLHTGLKPYVCHKCPESFSRNDDFKRHLLRHTFQKPFRCSICKTGYSDRACLKVHMTKEHSCNVFHVCHQCGECYEDLHLFQEHRKTHAEFQNYRCSLCSFIGSNALMYNKHMLTHGPAKQYTCTHCDISFPDPFTYTGHLKKHKGDELVQSYCCCFCELTLPTFEQFQRHEHSHVHSKQHTCNVCQKHFRYPSNLREHMLTHIPKSDLMDASKDHSIDVNNYHPNTDQTTNTENISLQNSAHEEDLFSNVTGTNNDELEENNNVISKPNGQYNSENEDNVSGSSEYWCTECHHGFGSEEDLQNHILSQHEQTGDAQVMGSESSFEMNADQVMLTKTTPPTNVSLSPYDRTTQHGDLDDSGDMYDTDTQLDNKTRIDGRVPYVKQQNKRKSNIAGRTYPTVKRNRLYDEDTLVDEDDDYMDIVPQKHIYQNIPIPAMSEIKKELKLSRQVTHSELKPNVLKTSLGIEHKSRDRSESIKRLLNQISSPDHTGVNGMPSTVGMVDGVEGMKVRRDSSSTSSLVDVDENAVTMSQFQNSKPSPVNVSFSDETAVECGSDADKNINGTKYMHGHYSKSSVLGMDTDFSETPNRGSPTTINLKVRNPGFEKVITPEVLFETKAPFTCEICKENFDEFKTFDQHGVRVHRRFICSYCGKAFTSRPNRERHVRYHTGEKPYKCDLCPVSFFRGDDLKYHRTTKHADIKPFTCGACQTSFAYPKDLEKHLKIHPDHKL